MGLLARVRWGNVGRLATVVGAVVVVALWPRLQPPPPQVPGGEVEAVVPAGRPGEDDGGAGARTGRRREDAVPARARATMPRPVRRRAARPRAARRRRVPASRPGRGPVVVPETARGPAGTEQAPGAVQAPGTVRAPRAAAPPRVSPRAAPRPRVGAPAAALDEFGGP